MVFSRYVTILRVAGRTLRSNISETRPNPKICFDQRIANCRGCVTHTKDHYVISKIPIDTPVSSETFHQNDPTVDTKILELTSAAVSPFDPGSGRCDGLVDESSAPDDLAKDDDLRVSDGLPGALEHCVNDISWIAPYVEPSFNFAAYANDSPTLQELAKLGVKLYKIEGMNNAMPILLRTTFEQMKPFIRFLHDCGVAADGIGEFITKNPYIFTQDIDDLHTRIRYLRAHKFDRDMTARIISKNPFWLMFSTKRIDTRLGYFQREFELDGNEVRYLATKQPKLITYKMKDLNQNVFAFKEEMGFDKNEIKAILLDKPRLLMKSRGKLVDLFDYVHNTMNLSHAMVSQKPKILTSRLDRLRQRHNYLKALGKDQYDPEKPMYVCPDAIVSGTDIDFCRDVAKTSMQTYNLYLKSL